MSTPPAKTPLTPAQAAELLARLQRDDEFRAAFASSPSTALSSLGVLSNPDGSYCEPLTQLASKEEFAEVSRLLQAQVQSNGAFVLPHFFEAGRIDDALKR